MRRSRPSNLNARHLVARIATSFTVMALLSAAANGTAEADGPGAPLSESASNPPGAALQLAIQAMTTVKAGGEGYFSDPYPVHLSPYLGERLQIFSGTTKAIMICAYPVSERCFSWTPITVDAGSLHEKISAAGATITNFQNIDLFQDNAGVWHAVVAIGVHSKTHPDHWTVLVHAHPIMDASHDAVPPLHWSADTVLTGSFSNRVDGNYDGKYFEERGQLYLLYVKNFVPKPALRNGIVIQPMLSPTQLAPEPPITLLTPGDRYGELESEWYDHTPAKLVEAPYIVRIANKYALIYSTGAYQQVDYKAGVAWSDTLLPPEGARYRKVLKYDTQGVWGQPDRFEVRYLLQSQKPRWPNFTGAQVISPGVASAVQGPGGAWRLFFAGFDPDDRPLVSPGVAEADHRRPYFVQLRAAVPPGRAVAEASDAELATWLQPEAQ
jgi:hypothetical protein